MMRRSLLVMIAAALLGTAAAAQQTPQPAPAPAPTPAPAPASGAVRSLDVPRPGTDQPNIRFDISISDEGGGITPVQKSVVLTVQGSGTGSLRSSGLGYLANTPTIPGGRGDRLPVDLNTDVNLAAYRPQEPNKIRARIAIDYQPFSPEWKSAPGRVRASVDVMLDNGKETALWQTTDPVMGVRTTIKVTATVLK
jgi:hypothetical protein